MAKSSIHIENGKAGYLAHNDRSKATVNSIFNDEKNELWNDKKDAFQIYRSELAARSDAYTKRTKQKLQKKAITHLSAIINLNQNHTLEDAKKVASLLERELGTKVFQIAVHRDEGHINDKGKNIKNYHAHIEFMGLDQEGNAIRQKLKKKMLMDLQSETAMVLKMERGKEYVKGVHPRPKRLGTYEYKAHKKEESKTVKAKQKDLKAEIAELREVLKTRNAERGEYAELEQLNRDLKAKIKAKDLTIAELQEQVTTFENEFLIKYEMDEGGNVDGFLIHKDVLAKEKELEQKHENELKTLQNDLDVSLVENQEKSSQIAILERSVAELQEAQSDYIEVIAEKDGELSEFQKLEEEFTLYKKAMSLVLERLKHPVEYIKELFAESERKLTNPYDETERWIAEVETENYEKKIPTLTPTPPSPSM